MSLSLYLDLTGGDGGGHWVKVIDYVDVGDWAGEPDNAWPPEEVEMRCNESATRVFTAPGTSVFIRNDLVSEANYKQFSIREIEPDPSLYNFENGIHGWASDSGIQLLPSIAHAYAGKQSLAVVFSGSQALKLQVFVAHPPLRPGEEIKVYVWIPSGSAILSVAPFVEDHNWNWTDNWQSVSKLTLDSWNEFTIRVPFGAELPFARLGVEFTSSAPWAGVCYVDSVGYR